MKQPILYTKSYNPDQVAILHEAVNTLLKECQHLTVRNRLNGGTDLTEDELEKIHYVMDFLGREYLDMSRYLLDCEADTPDKKCSTCKHLVSCEKYAIGPCNEYERDDKESAK